MSVAQKKLLDFSDTNHQAFSHGFFKGLAAPVMLFGQFDLPETQKIEKITVPSIDAKQALENDWIAIGNDFKKVIANYEK